MTENDPFKASAYWESRLAGEPSLKGVGFISLGRAFNVWMYRVRAHVFARTVSGIGLNLSTGRVLDAGSGTGFYIDQWRRLGVSEVFGLDLTESSAKLLANRFPDVPFFVTDIGALDALDSLPIDAGSLDAASCMDVLFHIVDDAGFQIALNNIAALLRLGGTFIYSDNCLHTEEIRLEHQVSRSLCAITEALEAAGFTIESRRPMLYLMNAPVDSGSVRRQLWWGRIARRLTATELGGWLTGAVMFPIERFLVAHRKESPTTEILTCRKVR